MTHDELVKVVRIWSGTMLNKLKNCIEEYMRHIQEMTLCSKCSSAGSHHIYKLLKLNREIREILDRVEPDTDLYRGANMRIVQNASRMLEGLVSGEDVGVTDDDIVVVRKPIEELHLRMLSMLKDNKQESSHGNANDDEPLNGSDENNDV